MTIRCIYLSYDGLLDPLGQSQVLPYILGLRDSGYSIDILSFEKCDLNCHDVTVLENRLANIGINWHRLAFSRVKYSFLSRAIFGALLLRRLCARHGYNLVHLRGLQSAILYTLSMVSAKSIYDIRGFLGEWLDIGRVTKDSIFHRVVSAIDSRVVENSIGIVVLEEIGRAKLFELYSVPAVPVSVIRTCTDVSRYPKKATRSELVSKPSIKFVHLGGVKSPYRLDLALILIKQLLERSIECTIDVIARYDQDYVFQLAKATGFPENRLRVLSLQHDEIPGALVAYDCGLIFNDVSPWRRLSSPTKLGEYLAAGLVVVALPGIEVVDFFAKDRKCVLTISELEIVENLWSADELVNSVSSYDVAHECRAMAFEHFDLSIANRKYRDLYSEVEKLI